ncbi:MAG TPA: hypothetical protein ENN81_01190 [Phycisphaerales bacterium]|nr:hypothetical protein [Phycisphaerales bacterium]
MKPPIEDNAALLMGIEADAHDEEQRVIREAEQQAAEKRKYARKKADALLEEARQRGRRQADTILRRAASAADLEAKRRVMGFRAQAVQDILDRAERKLQAMIDRPEYPSILRRWITEAAIGLDVDAAEVSASQAERALITDDLLAQAAAEVAARTGQQVSLRLSEGRPLSFQGVILTAASGRIAFNNQVKTRMSRNEREIRRLVYTALFTDNPQEQP